MLDEWKRFIEGLPAGGGLSRIILESWERCRSFEVNAAMLSLRRVPLAELQERMSANAALVTAARPHLRWALASMAPAKPVVVVLTDADGIILESMGNAPESMSAYGLLPGYDWSERAMGTNGPGTALAYGAPVAIVGVEHYSQAWHNHTCTGAPIRGAGGRIVGAVDISTTVADGDPSRLVLVSFLAHLIGRELGAEVGHLSRFADEALLERAVASGSSASRTELVRYAQDLHALADSLTEAARLELGPVASLNEEEVALDDVLSRKVGSLPGVSVHVEGAEGRTLRGNRRRVELALTHLVSVATRHGQSRVQVLLSATASELCVEIHALEGSSGAPSNRWRMEQTGLVLDLWLARETVTALGGTLEVDTTETPRFTARFPANAAGAHGDASTRR